MSLTVQQLLTDAKRLSTRLRDHDQTADTLITRSDRNIDSGNSLLIHNIEFYRAQEVLKQVDAMRQYQEDVENLNEVAHNRPRAQLVLGIQQENRHIRTLQQENKELRAALEEHQVVPAGLLWFVHPQPQYLERPGAHHVQVQAACHQAGQLSQA